MSSKHSLQRLANRQLNHPLALNELGTVSAALGNRPRLDSALASVTDALTSNLSSGITVETKEGRAKRLKRERDKKYRLDKKLRDMAAKALPDFSKV